MELSVCFATNRWHSCTLFQEYLVLFPKFACLNKLAFSSGKLVSYRSPCSLQALFDFKEMEAGQRLVPLIKYYRNYYALAAPVGNNSQLVACKIATMAIYREIKRSFKKKWNIPSRIIAGELEIQRTTDNALYSIVIISIIKESIVCCKDRTRLFPIIKYNDYYNFCEFLVRILKVYHRHWRQR